MAYLHCHQCHWEQDDFWSFKFYRSPGDGKLHWSYNPIQTFFSYVRVWKAWQPYMIERQTGGARNNDYRKYKTFSYVVLWQLFWKMVKKFWTMKWWTYDSWIADYRKGWGCCPKCWHNLCLD